MVTDVEEQDRSLEVGGSYLSPFVSCSESELWHSPAYPSIQHLPGILTPANPQTKPRLAAPCLPYQTLATLNTEHIPLCLVARAALASCHTVTLLAIPKD